MALPLEGVRILAVEQFGAGPFGSLHLADLGAEVIKIEDPNSGGDVGRHVPPYITDTDSLYLETFNRGKKSIVLDLATDAGRAVFNDLVGGFAARRRERPRAAREPTIRPGPGTVMSRSTPPCCSGSRR
ncbi:CoA transferase [Streptomyces sp. NPDC004721]